MGAKSSAIFNHSVPGALLNAEEIEDFAFVMGDAFSDCVLMGALNFRLLGRVVRFISGLFGHFSNLPPRSILTMTWMGMLEIGFIG